MNEKNIKLGILGGGQLGQMSAIAAKKLGIKCIVLTPEDNSPASQVAYETILSSYTNEAALKDLASKVDFISYEFENIPVETIEFLSKLKPVYPKKSLLEVSQDRIKEKSFLNSIDIPTTRWAAITTKDDIIKTLTEWEANEAIIKTARFGYDGKGQERISIDTNFETLLTQYKNQSLIMEEIIDFDCEISVIIARDIKGQIATYGPMLNAHKNHILDTTTIPAPVEPNIAENALRLTKTLAENIDLTGILTLELFVTKGGKLLANEIAPRTHNSGHWTIDACEHSQFENHVRTVCEMDVADSTPHSNALMINLIGEDINNTQKYKDNPNAHIHNYGKTEVKHGRKMGHVTITEKL